MSVEGIFYPVNGKVIARSSIERRNRNSRKSKSGQDCGSGNE